MTSPDVRLGNRVVPLEFTGQILARIFFVRRRTVSLQKFPAPPRTRLRQRRGAVVGWRLLAPRRGRDQRPTVGIGNFIGGSRGAGGLQPPLGALIPC